MNSHRISPPSIAASVERAQGIRFVELVMTTIVVYDWLICSSEEIEFIWRAGWSMGRCLYFYTRYITFVNIAIVVFAYFAAHPDPDHCVRLFKSAMWIGMILMYITELIPIWRTYGLWNRYKPVLYILLFLWMGWVVCFIYALLKMTQVLWFRSDIPQIPGCHLRTGTPAAAALSTIPLVLVEIAIVVLTAIKCAHHIRSDPSSLILILYRDSLLFFVFLLAIAIAKTVSIFAAPHAYFEMFATLLRGMFPVLYCRVILNLRATAQRDSMVPSRVSDVRFWGSPGTQLELSNIQQDSSTSTAPVDSADAVKSNV